jgi:hypothetical protein
MPLHLLNLYLDGVESLAEHLALLRRWRNHAAQGMTKAGNEGLRDWRTVAQAPTVDRFGLFGHAFTTRHVSRSQEQLQTVQYRTCMSVPLNNNLRPS